MSKRKKSKITIDKIIASVLTSIAFIMALFISVIFGTLIVILIEDNAVLVLESYVKNPEYFLSVYSFAMIFLAVFGVWFANKFYKA